MTMTRATFPPLVPEMPPIRIDEQGVARVGQTRVTLDTVVWEFNQGLTPEEMVINYSTLRIEDVYSVVAYYLRHRNAVDAYVAAREREAEDLRAELEREFDHAGFRERLLARMRSGQ